MPIKLGRPRMTPQEFSAKWADNELKESAASKEHFLDVCALVGSPTPRDADKQGDWFAFEKGVAKGSLAGVSSKNGRKKQGFADVFLRGSFAWEYKGPHKDLDGAYAQLQLYRDALENPPLMIVSDMDRFMVRTNFNDMAVEELAFTNQMIGADDGTSVALLRTAFSEPYSLVPGKSREAITREVAERFGVLAKGLRERGEEPHVAASFLMRLVFCLFAEDANLLSEGLFGEMISASPSSPERFPERAGSLFRAMAEPGGEVNWKPIRHFNGGLFTDDTALSLTREELGVLDQAAKLDWGAVEPARCSGRCSSVRWTRKSAASSGRSIRATSCSSSSPSLWHRSDGNGTECAGRSRSSWPTTSFPPTPARGPERSTGSSGKYRRSLRDSPVGSGRRAFWTRRAGRATSCT